MWSTAVLKLQFDLSDSSLPAAHLHILLFVFKCSVPMKNDNPKRLKLQNVAISNALPYEAVTQLLIFNCTLICFYQANCTSIYISFHTKKQNAEFTEGG